MLARAVPQRAAAVQQSAQTRLPGTV